MNTDTEQPLPAMPDTPAVELWALHIQGSDDILAMPDRKTAEADKALYDAADDQTRTSGDPHRPLLNAVVIPWPSSAESHADDLRRQDDES